jgi:HEAT repeat protein
MKRHALMLVAALLAVVAPAAASLPVDSGTRLEPLLHAIERMPARATLDDVAGGSARQALVEIARDPRGATQARLMALTALGDYVEPSTAAALRGNLAALRDFDAGPQTLYLRAAALSLARVDGEGAVEDLAPLLDHVLPDVRADAAHALELTGAARALPLLRARLRIETVMLVRVALIDAIRALAN